ncbi:MAG: insulinase family protein [Phycisphaerales bacterium]|nr:insulinase family protein [Phycisphaerales bacterium]MCB9857240.1 insulinase family protein [Phycisphaerales bacterium]MCB9863046.1 insulinase family protein [Phycisphaerales bacterium]
MTQSNGFHEHTLKNGLRIIVETMPHVRSAAAGFLVRTGARDETPELAGVSHFVEHMCFKGTAKRGWEQITRDFDDMGSTYNAYTSKERTVYFGWVRVEDLERQIELLADMMQSTMPTEEFDMEKNVILEEIAMSDDSLERKVYDLLHERLYPGHPLSWPVLGTTASITALSRDSLHGYFVDRYHPRNMVLIVTGAVEPKAVYDMAQRICGDWTPAEPRPARTTPTSALTGIHKGVVDRFQRQAVGVLYPAPSAADEDRDIGDLVASILGGRNSRFFWNIIQTGIAANVAAGRLDYCDAGLMLAFGFTEPDRADELLDAMRGQIKKLQDEGVTDDEVQRVRNRVATSLASEGEAPYYRFSQMIQEIDVFGVPRTVEERLAVLEKATPAVVREYLARWPLQGDGAVISLGPRDWPV